MTAIIHNNIDLRILLNVTASKISMTKIQVESDQNGSYRNLQMER